MLLLVVCAITPQLTSLRYGFVDYDDEPGIVDLPLIRSLDLTALFKLEVYPGLPEYMPLKNLSYAIDYALFGLSGPAFRVQQLFWYVLSVLLLYVWLSQLMRALGREQRLGLPAAWADGIALTTTALYALHPVHVESVTWLSGRKDVLSGAFMALALCAAFAWQPRWDRRNLAVAAGTCLATALALLSKPMACVLPGLMLLADWVCAPSMLGIGALLRKRAPLYAAVCSLVLLFALVYVQLVHAYMTVDAEHAGDLFTGPGVMRWGQQLQQFLLLVIFPNQLAPRLPASLLDVHTGSLRNVLGLITLLFTLACSAWLLRRRHPLSLALGLFVLPVLPVLIAPAWGQYVAGRYLFLAVAGPLFAWVWLGAYGMQSRPRLAWAAWGACTLIGLRLLVGSLDYSCNWRDSVALWSGAVEVYPHVAEYYERAGTAATRAGNTALAALIFQACLHEDPADSACNLGLALPLTATDPARARMLLERALPGDLTGRAHTALALQRAVSGDAPGALTFYERWLQGRVVTPDDMRAYAQLALLAEQPQTAWRAAVQSTQLIAARFPAGPPPSKLLVEAAAARGGSALSDHVREVLARCSRADCVSHALAHATVHGPK